MNKSDDHQPVPERKPRGFWMLFGTMGMVALASLLGSLPTCSLSMLFCGSLGAFAWLNLDHTPRELAMKKSAVAGGITGGFMGILLGTVFLLTPPARSNLSQTMVEWVAVLAMTIVVLALFSAATGMLGGIIYKSRAFAKPVTAPSGMDISKAGEKHAAVQPGIIDIEDPAEGEILPLANATEWHDIVVRFLSQKEASFKIALLRSELDVLMIDTRLSQYSSAYKSGVASIGYNTDDRQNDAMMQAAKPIVLVPKDVVFHRPLCFYVPADISSIKFLILRQDSQSVRIIQRPNSYRQFELKVRME